MGIQEEWRNRAYVEDSLGGWHNVEVQSRPGKVLPIAVAHYLTPDSYVGYNLLHAGLIFGKGVLLFLLLRRLAPGGDVVAALTAMLLVVFPADEGILTTRSTPIHMASLLYLLALYTLLLYWIRPKVWKLLVVWLSLAVSLLTYEVSYPLVFFSPLLLVWLQKGVSRRVVRVSLMWYAIPALTFVRSLEHLFFRPSSMQGNLLDAGMQGSGLIGAIPEMLDSVWLAYARHFVIGWRIGLEQLTDNPLYLALGVITLGIAAFTGFVVYRQIDVNRSVPTSGFLRQCLLFAVVGIVFIGLAILIYLPTSRRYEDWRVYYFSSIGGAVATGMIVLTLSFVLSRRWMYWIFGAVMCLLIGLGTVRLLHQHQFFYDVAADEQYILGKIIRDVPQLTESAVFLVIAPPDEAPLEAFGRLDRAVTFRAALSFIYQNYNNVFDAAICYSFWNDCDFGEDVLLLNAVNQYTYDQVLIFQASAKTGLTLLDEFPPYLLDVPPDNYDPNRLIAHKAELPVRVHTLFDNWPVRFDYPLIDPESFAEFVEPVYRPNQPVLLGMWPDDCLGRSNCRLETWLSGQVMDVSESNRFYIAPTQIPSSKQLENLHDLIADSRTVWYLQTNAQNPRLDAYLDVIRENFGVYRNAPWNSDIFPAVTIYRRKPDNLTEIFRFGEVVSLQSWMLHGDIQVEPCQIIRVSSWWRAEAVIDHNYSMTLTLADVDGIGIVQADGAPANVLTQLWIPGDDYLDKRSLTIPCDAEPGEYALLTGLYDTESVTPLSFTAANGVAGDGLVYLTTLVVE